MNCKTCDNQMQHKYTKRRLFPLSEIKVITVNLYSLVGIITADFVLNCGLNL